MFRLFFLFSLLFSPLLAVEDGTSSSVQISFFDDSNSSYTIKEVIEKNTKLFHHILEEGSTRFHPKVALWLKVDLFNKSKNDITKVIEFLDIRLDRMDIYTADGYQKNTIGDRVPFSNRVYADAQIAVGITAMPEQDTTIYIKFMNHDKSDLTYQVIDEEDYIKSVTFKKVVHAFFFGTLFIMFIYNVVLYLFIREKTFLIYIIYHSILIIVMLYYNGLVSQYFYPNSYDVNGGNVPSFLSFSAIVLAMQFLRYFLNVQNFTPKIDLWLQVLIYINIVFLILAPFGVLHKSIAIFNMMPLSIFLLYVASYHAFILKRKLAFFYLFGWLVMLVAIIFTGLLSMGIIERNDFTAYIFQLGIMIEITLLSMGLAYRYKLNQEQLVEKTKILHEQAKLASMGEMIQHIAHQWRQPLSEINSVAMKIESDHRRKLMTDSNLDANIEHIESLTEHMSQTISDFNGYFKSNKKKASIPLKQVVDKALGLVMGGLVKSTIDVQVVENYSENVSVVEGELIQVLLVLLNNARDVLNERNPDVKWIKLTISKENDSSIIEIEDSAGGINIEPINKVFEPYFTTKFESQGVGIGLYMSKMIVEESLKGTLGVADTEYGAKFTIKFT